MGLLYTCRDLVFLIILAMVLAGCIQAAPSTPAITVGYHNVNAQEARSIKHESDGKLVIIDLSSEFTEGHLPMAINIPLGSLEEKIPTLDKSRPYLIYSRSDDSSMTGAAKLVDAGFSPVYRLKGNYESWIAAGYPEV